MNEQEIFDLLIKHILKIYDSEDNEIKYHSLKISKEKRKFSKTISIVFYIDDIPLSCKQYRSYKVLYQCRCGRQNKILLRKYCIKTKIVCPSCIQNRNFDYFIVTNSLRKNKELYHKKDLIKKEYDFNKESGSFKENYFKNHFRQKEFYKYLPYIYSINHIQIQNKKIEYIEAEKTNNQFKYTSKVIIDGNKMTLKSIELQCSKCKNIFTIHPMNIKYQDLDEIECKICKFANKKYKIQTYKNSELTYQSKLEYNFIEKCIENNIKIQNCFKIDYIFNNTVHKYTPDFYLPEYKMIIELKSKNQYYKIDLKSGKLEAKSNAAIEYAKSNDMNFVFLFDYDVDEFFKKLLNK